MRKLKGLILLAVFMVGLMTGCTNNANPAGGKDPTVSPSSVGTAKEDPTKLKMAFYIWNDVPADWDEVAAAINKIALEKINATVEFELIQQVAWEQQSNLLLSSGEKLDLMVLKENTFSGNIAKGQLLPLDDLLDKHGKDIKAAVNENYLKASQMDGKTYGITSLRSLARDIGLVVRKDYIDKYNIDISQIKELKDLEVIFSTVKANEPNLFPFLIDPNKAFTPASLLSESDMLSDGYGVLQDYGQNLNVVNYYETEKYANILNLLRKWYKAGYIMKDVATDTQGTTANFKAGVGVSFLQVLKPGQLTSQSNMLGTELVGIPLTKKLTTSSNVQTLMWGIPINSTESEKAMQFLNLMYGDEDIVNLLSYGIEGKHYVTKDDGTIGFPQGVDFSNSGYNLQMGWVFGNQFLSHVWTGDALTLWDETKAYNDSAIMSKAMGFVFNTSSIKTEMAALNAVADQYRLGLETGSMDPAVYLAEFTQKLKVAGIDKVISEKQQQLNKWAEKK